MASNLKSIVENAVQKFRDSSGVSSKDLSDMRVTTLLDLQRVLYTAEQEQLRSRAQRCLRRLQPFLDNMDRYTQAINVLANTSDIVAFIWVPFDPHHFVTILLI